MTPQQRTDIYQRRDALLTQLNYADEEADDLKRQIETYNQEMADEERARATARAPMASGEE